MKLGGLILLYENKEIIVTIIVLSIMFFIYWDKRSLHLDDKQTNDFKWKWYDVSQIDIISSKIGIFLFLIISLLLLVVKV